jgi:hypothetical protein
MHKYAIPFIFLFAISMSYWMCPTHEWPADGRITRANSFCAMPFWALLLFGIGVFLYRHFHNKWFPRYAY